MNFKEYLLDATDKYGIKLSDDQLRQFEIYFRLLMEWNEKINLTAITEPREVAVKHIVDSLSCWNDDYFKESVKFIDVGTGAGFPGIPMKIYRPHIKLTLLDSLNKRINFLKNLVDNLGLEDVECIHGRAEENARNKEMREKYDAAVSRAVARLPVLAEYCLPFVKKGGVFAAMKGMKYIQEMKEAERALSVLGGEKPDYIEVKLPYIDDKRAVIYIKKERHTPGIYPRKAGTPEKAPLV